MGANRMPLKMPYVQDMPPKGGYPQIPYKRHLPKRGLGTIGCFVAGGMSFLFHSISTQEQKRIMYLGDNEDQQSMAAWKPLFQAEKERMEIRKKRIPRTTKHESSGHGYLSKPRPNQAMGWSMGSM